MGENSGRERKRTWYVHGYKLSPRQKKKETLPKGKPVGERAHRFVGGDQKCLSSGGERGWGSDYCATTKKAMAGGKERGGVDSEDRTNSGFKRKKKGTRMGTPSKSTRKKKNLGLSPTGQCTRGLWERGLPIGKEGKKEKEEEEIRVKENRKKERGKFVYHQGAGGKEIFVQPCGGDWGEVSDKESVRGAKKKGKKKEVSQQTITGGENGK